MLTYIYNIDNLAESLKDNSTLTKLNLNYKNIRNIDNLEESLKDNSFFNKINNIW